MTITNCDDLVAEFLCKGGRVKVLPSREPLSVKQLRYTGMMFGENRVFFSSCIVASFEQGGMGRVGGKNRRHHRSL